MRPERPKGPDIRHRKRGIHGIGNPKKGTSGGRSQSELRVSPGLASEATQAAEPGPRRPKAQAAKFFSESARQSNAKHVFRKSFANEAFLGRSRK